ncbi:uncharacterized protein LOC105249824 [Camponotus floridanus]|uniref:uncharacterized protein LOC105249824 n=1 Tax=Camponotus floridanus TaxID=104421 RepID=UPI00059C7AAF|nr:uncharacterized protein LOC105249824 [Camponotus floridanus]
MSQKENESIDQFVTRLRQQAKYCSFVSVDEECRDQIIERCQMPEIRRRALEKRDVTLGQIVEIAQALEATSVRLKSMDKTETVAKISQKGNKKPPQKNNEKDINYYRCEYKGHQQWEEKCPAKGKRCDNCNAIGHFVKMSRTKTTENEKKKDETKWERRNSGKKDFN